MRCGGRWPGSDAPTGTGRRSTWRPEHGTGPWWRSTAAEQAGLDPAAYAVHSLRAGMITSAAEHGDPMERKDAKLAGVAHYFTGRPCEHGHIAERYTSNGNCIVCAQER